MQYNIIIFDIDKKQDNLLLMNLLQFKWIMYILAQKNNFKIKNNKLKFVIK